MRNKAAETQIFRKMVVIRKDKEIPRDQIIYFGRAVMFQISNVYALRMAGVFMILLGTICLRTGLMPR